VGGARHSGRENPFNDDNLLYSFIQEQKIDYRNLILSTSNSGLGSSREHTARAHQAAPPAAPVACHPTTPRRARCGTTVLCHCNHPTLYQSNNNHSFPAWKGRCCLLCAAGHVDTDHADTRVSVTTTLRIQGPPASVTLQTPPPMSASLCDPPPLEPLGTPLQARSPWPLY
jgi:hypothetical protein